MSFNNGYMKAKRFFNISSGTSLNSTNNTFSAPIKVDYNARYNRIVCTKVNIPQSYYLVQTNQNTFTLTENGTSVSITVPIGNYNIASWCNTIANLLTTNSPLGYVYTCTYESSQNTNVTTGKIYYRVNSRVVTASITVSTNISEQFGFTPGAVNTFTPGTIVQGFSTLISTNVCSFVNENTLYITSNLVSEQNQILVAVYNGNSMPYQNIVYECPDPIAYSKQLIETVGDTVNFSITDENFSPIYLNGIDLVIEFVLWREEPIFDRLFRVVSLLPDTLDAFLTIGERLIVLSESSNKQLAESHDYMKTQNKPVDQPKIVDLTLSSPTGYTDVVDNGPKILDLEAKQ